ncbi:MAG TPA: N-acetyltransferase [Candidatus Limnocylindrales bacterium]
MSDALVVRAERPGDIDAIREVVLQAFCDEDNPLPGEPGLIDALRDGPAWIPELSIVAEVDGGVVAHALLSRVTVEERDALVLGPVAVLPGRQRQGLGAAVVRAGLEAARARGERLVLVLGAPAYYGRFGFEPAERYGLTSAWSDAGDAWQCLPLDSEAGRAGHVTFPRAWYAF